MEQKDFEAMSKEERVEAACFSEDPEELEFLSTDESAFVRALVAINENTSEETLKKMKENDDGWINSIAEYK